MKHPIYPEPSDDIKIVFIQSHKFLALWKNMQYPQESQLSFGNETIWRRDYKFHYAERGFSFGRKNPVPLAEVRCNKYIKRTPIYKKTIFCFSKLIGYNQSEEVECSFINGITRTIWLLANEITQFPVYVYNENETILLAKHAGVTPESYYDLTELNSELEYLMARKNLYEPLS